MPLLHWLTRDDDTHHAVPRFKASWTCGEDDRPKELCWTSQGSGPDDSIHLFGWTWADPKPAPPALESLMEQAAAAIDDWIAHRL